MFGLPWLLFSPQSFFVHFITLVYLIKHFHCKYSKLCFSDKPNNYVRLCSVMDSHSFNGPTLSAKWCMCECVCLCWSLRYRGRESAAACPSPPAEAELVTVYWLSNIWCLQGVCSRWSKLAEWLWQTHNVRRCCKVNKNIRPSQSDFRFFSVFFSSFFFHNLPFLWLKAYQ